MACFLRVPWAMKSLFQPAGGRGRARFGAVVLSGIAAFSFAAGCSKAPPAVDQRVVMGDAITAGMCERFGWKLISSQPEDETTTMYVFERPENFQQSVQVSIAEASAESKDKARLSDKELSEVEKTDGKE
jgi:hypothetical protein